MQYTKNYGANSTPYKHRSEKAKQRMSEVLRKKPKYFFQCLALYKTFIIDITLNNNLNTIPETEN